MTLGNEEIKKRFGLHAAAIEAPLRAEVHGDIRKLFVEMAQKLDVLLPDSRAKSVAFTELETASMWFHKALAE